MKNIVPYVKLLSNSYGPNLIASNTNQMRIEFNEALNFEAKFFQLRRGYHSLLLFLIPIWSLDVIHYVHGLYQIVIHLLLYSSFGIFEFTSKYGFDFN
jgi:hypothetical protein